MKSVVKGLLFGGLLLAYFAGASLLALAIRPPEKLRQARLRWCQRCAQWCLKVLGIAVDYGDPAQQPPAGRAALLVCNHLSYLDIIAIAAKYPAVFVTSMEIRDTPVLGHISKLAGCEFVERRNRSTVERDIQVLGQIMSGGTNVCLFPEGTSTNGAGVLPFKRSLLTSALRGRVDVVPLCLNYRHVDEQAVDAHNRDDLFWYGDMDFFPHLMRVLRRQRIHLELAVCHTIPFSDRITRDEIADIAYERIAGTFLPIR